MRLLKAMLFLTLLLDGAMCLHQAAAHRNSVQENVSLLADADDATGLAQAHR